VRLVLDTNVLVSGLISDKGAPAILFDAWFEGRFSLITSPDQLSELERVLNYDRIRSRLGPGQAEVFLQSLEVLAERVDAARGIKASRDPDDNLIIGTAVSGMANLLVTGDKSDLLSLGKFQGIRIVSARQAVEILQAAEKKMEDPESH